MQHQLVPRCVLWQFSEISSYFSELNDSVPTSVEPPYYIKENMWDKSHA
ncbi:hypothetical protein HMPREF9509_02564 [Enterococcus faecalis TX0411]|nr:hypothetical protein HMPREF9509_02564 [Enterococcus faecalis TX0411]